MKLAVVNLGLMRYAEALDLQRAVATARIAGQVTDDVLLLVEHPPVVTLGRGTKPGHLVASEAQLRSRGVELFEVERGGDVTFHGPGQLVGYPVIDLKGHRRDLHWYLRQLEESLIRALASFGLPSTRKPGSSGVWTGGEGPAAPAGGSPVREDSEAIGSSPARKIASVGVHVREWVTWHGFALNVSTNLASFSLIVPCGLQGVEMTSLERERPALAGPSLMPEVTSSVVAAFGQVFSLQTEPVSVAGLEYQISMT